MAELDATIPQQQQQPQAPLKTFTIGYRHCEECQKRLGKVQTAFVENCLRNCISLSGQLNYRLGSETSSKFRYPLFVKWVREPVPPSPYFVLFQPASYGNFDAEMMIHATYFRPCLSINKSPDIRYHAVMRQGSELQQYRQYLYSTMRVNFFEEPDSVKWQLTYKSKLDIISKLKEDYWAPPQLAKTPEYMIIRPEEPGGVPTTQDLIMNTMKVDGDTDTNSIENLEMLSYYIQHEQVSHKRTDRFLENGSKDDFAVNFEHAQMLEAQGMRNIACLAYTVALATAQEAEEVLSTLNRVIELARGQTDIRNIPMQYTTSQEFLVMYINYVLSSYTSPEVAERLTVLVELMDPRVWKKLIPAIVSKTKLSNIVTTLHSPTAYDVKVSLLTAASLNTLPIVMVELMNAMLFLRKTTVIAEALTIFAHIAEGKGPVIFSSKVGAAMGFLPMLEMNPSIFMKFAKKKDRLLNAVAEWHSATDAMFDAIKNGTLDTLQSIWPASPGISVYEEVRTLDDPNKTLWYADRQTVQAIADQLRRSNKRPSNRSRGRGSYKSSRVSNQQRSVRVQESSSSSSSSSESDSGDEDQITSRLMVPMLNPATTAVPSTSGFQLPGPSTALVTTTTTSDMTSGDMGNVMSTSSPIMPAMRAAMNMSEMLSPITAPAQTTSRSGEAGMMYITTAAGGEGLGSALPTTAGPSTSNFPGPSSSLHPITTALTTAMNTAREIFDAEHLDIQTPGLSATDFDLGGGDAGVVVVDDTAGRNDDTLALSSMLPSTSSTTTNMPTTTVQTVTGFSGVLQQQQQGQELAQELVLQGRQVQVVHDPQLQQQQQQFSQMQQQLQAQQQAHQQQIQQQQQAQQHQALALVDFAAVGQESIRAAMAQVPSAGKKENRENMIYLARPRRVLWKLGGYDPVSISNYNVPSSPFFVANKIPFRQVGKFFFCVNSSATEYLKIVRNLVKAMGGNMINIMPGRQATGRQLGETLWNIQESTLSTWIVDGGDKYTNPSTVYQYTILAHYNCGCSPRVKWHLSNMYTIQLTIAIKDSKITNVLAGGGDFYPEYDNMMDVLFRSLLAVASKTSQNMTFQDITALDHKCPNNLPENQRTITLEEYPYRNQAMSQFKHKRAAAVFAGGPAVPADAVQGYGFTGFLQ